MTNDERAKLFKQLQEVRQEIDALYSQSFSKFVEAVHSLSLMLNPIMLGQEAMAFKLIEIYKKLEEDAMQTTVEEDK